MLFISPILMNELGLSLIESHCSGVCAGIESCWVERCSDIKFVSSLLSTTSLTCQLPMMISSLIIRTVRRAGEGVSHAE